MADSASVWSSSGVSQPPRIPSRSLFTVPPGVVEHPHAVLGRPLLSSDSPGHPPSGPGPVVAEPASPARGYSRRALPQPNHQNRAPGRPAHSAGFLKASQCLREPIKLDMTARPDVYSWDMTARPERHTPT